jgi:Sigma-70, region 4
LSDETKTQKRLIPELLEIAIQSGASVRLENCLRQAYGSGRLKIRTVLEYLEHAKDGPPPVFFAIPNLGAKSRRELHAIVLRAASDEAVDTSFQAPSTTTDIVQSTCVSEGAGSTEPPRVLLRSLDPRELSVITQRFGLAGHSSATLEEVGASFNVTRERIRQIERKALGKLARQQKQELLAYLKRNTERIVAHLWKGIPWLSGRDLDVRMRTLDGEAALAIEVAYSSRIEWLTEFAISVGHGWLLRLLDPAEFKRIAQRVSNGLEGALLPTSVALLAASLEIEQPSAIAAVAFAGNYSVFRGYVCPLVVGARTRRTVLLVETLLKAGRGRALRMAPLAEAEAIRDPTTRSSPSVRDLNIVLASHKHLFVNLYEEGWATCAPAAESNRLDGETIADASIETEELDSEEGEKSASASDEHTLRAFMIDLLGARGPMQMADIRDSLVQMRAGAFSPSSVGPVLLLHDDFIRIAPGTYALRSAWRSGLVSVDQIESVLLTEFHCAIYVQSRWAGEPQNLYPAWTAAMELAWARWARRNHETQLLQSLLAVVNPDTWPMGETERRTWTTLASRGYQYTLQEKLRTPIDETIPPFLDVLSAALWARQQGHLSWISANRTGGRRINDRHAASTMALLIVFGILQPAEHWQAKHSYRPTADRIINDMLDFAFRTDARWPMCLVNAASSATDDALRAGWLRNHDLIPLLADICFGSPLSTQAAARLDPSGREILSELREQSRRSKLAEIIEE